MKVNSIISNFANLAIPINLTAILLVVALLLLLIKFNKLAYSITVIAVAWLVLWSLPGVSILSGSVLEQMHPGQNIKHYSHTQAIVVLGGNTANSRANWFEAPQKDTAILRSDTAIKLYRAGLADLIIVAGASLDGGISEASIMANKMKRLGIPASAILEEEQSKTTHQNAIFTARLLHQHNIDSFLLVTSALHMPRAYASFSKLGFKPIAAPTPAQINKPASSNLNLWLPDLRTLNASRTIIKEYLALAVYWLRGWI